jgi:hypothetical protein
MMFRVVEWLPDEGRGFAIAADPFTLRKVFVHTNRVTTHDRKIQIGSLIDCDPVAPKNGQRHWRAENIKVVR